MKGDEVGRELVMKSIFSSLRYLFELYLAHQWHKWKSVVG